jgi:hypothetical protein
MALTFCCSGFSGYTHPGLRSTNLERLGKRLYNLHQAGRLALWERFEQAVLLYFTLYFFLQYAD